MGEANIMPSNLPPNVTNADVEAQVEERHDPIWLTFGAIMAEFQIVAGGHPVHESQERIMAHLERLWDDAYNEGLEAERRP